MLWRFVSELKTKPCLDCKISYPSYIMDFDHRTSTEKVGSIARMIREGASKEKILVEIETCDLVCANCHRERTYQRLKFKLRV